MKGTKKGKGKGGRKIVAVALLAALTGAPLAAGSMALTGCAASIEKHGPQAVEAAYLALGTAFAAAREVRAAGGMSAERYAEVFAALEQASNMIKQAEALTGDQQAALLGAAQAKIQEVK